MNRKVILGVTGHRDIVVTDKLKSNITNLLVDLCSKNKEVILMSPLADGADRLVAKLFLNLQSTFQGLKLIVPIPFEQTRYMEDFDEASKQEFLEYIKVANSVVEVKNTEGCPYRSVGVYVADKSDILLALWDGTFNHKSGGTGDIVQYARDKNIEVVHFVCSRRYE